MGQSVPATVFVPSRAMNSEVAGLEIIEADANGLNSSARVSSVTSLM